MTSAGDPGRDGGRPEPERAGGRPGRVGWRAGEPIPDAAYRLLVEAVQDYAVFLLAPDGRVTSWNTGAERIKGYRAEEIIGRHFSTFYPPEDVLAGKPDRELVVAASEGRLEDEGWRVRKDGSRFWANVVITALYDQHGVLQGFGKVTRDLTERRAAEHQIGERRRLLAHLVDAQEIERRRIAWDVHDDSIQAMVAVGMRLQLLADRVPPAQRAMVTQLDVAVRATVQRLRDLVFRLRPAGVDEHGLVEAVAGYLDQAVAGPDLRIILRHELDREPPAATAVTVFRILQEALTNVRRHARASRVEVAIMSARSGLLVRVRDDGVGASYPLADSGQDHFGIIEMRERAEMAGGWWAMRGEPGAGTTVEFWVPTPPPDGPDSASPGQ